jgi:hypothetical protein
MVSLDSIAGMERLILNVSLRRTGTLTAPDVVQLKQTLLLAQLPAMAQPISKTLLQIDLSLSPLSLP